MEMTVLILAIQVSVLVSLVLSVTFIEFFLLLVDLMPRCNFFSRTVVSQWAHFDVVRMLRFTFVLGCYDSHALYTYCSFYALLSTFIPTILRPPLRALCDTADVNIEVTSADFFPFTPGDGHTTDSHASSTARSSVFPNVGLQS